MSNKLVPLIYRNIVDDVMNNITSEFEEFGVGQDVLHDLQSRWEMKIMQSNVADFDGGQSNGPGSTHPAQLQYPSALPALPGPPPQRYNLPSLEPPPLAGPPPSGAQYGLPSNGNGPISLSQAGPSTGYPSNPLDPTRPPLSTSSSSSDESRTPPPASKGNGKSASRKPAPDPDDETIGSDLDDSDDDDNAEGENGDLTGGAQDVMFCTYDKVQRVKTKWKVTLKDGMIHLNGKDYLFSKCSGEFEW